MNAKKKAHPGILLVGTGSLLNYGCEGIVQGTYELLQEYWPESHLFVGSDNIDYDKTVFQNCKNISFIPYKKRVTPYRITMGILRRIGIGKGSPVRMDKTVIDPFDIFLSAGGDNFAEAPDGSIYNILKDLMIIGKRAKQKNKMYVVWGASVGPFNSLNYGIITENLRNADAIFLREKISFDYLKKMALTSDHIYQAADPAFWMEPDSNDLPLKKERDQFLIGLNISPLSISHSYSDSIHGKAALFKSLDYLLHKNKNFLFLCIPHVAVEAGGAQDDNVLFQEYYQFSSHKQQIKILEFGLGARKTKSIISQCDLLIAARMHCCVAGISTGTPTLLLTYSQKGIGMSQYVYGDLEMALPVKDINEKILFNKVEMIKSSLQKYKTHLQNQQLRFKKDASVGMLKLKQIYSDLSG